MAYDSKAAALISRTPMTHNYAPELLMRVAQALEDSGLKEKAGGLYEKLGLLDRAMDSYVAGR